MNQVPKALTFRMPFIVGGTSLLFTLASSQAYAVTITCNTVAACAFGNNTSSGAGVQGSSSSGHGINGTSKTGFGVVGTTNQNDVNVGKAGVEGIDTSKGDFSGYSPNSGVYGSSNAGAGVQGFSSNGVGVIASSTTGFGLIAQATYGGIETLVNSTRGVAIFAGSENGGTAVEADVYQNNGTALSGAVHAGGAILKGSNGSNDVVSIDSVGNMILAGTLSTHGTPLIATMSSNGTAVAAFGPRTASPTVEDTGEAQLVNGRAYIPLDAAFAGTINRQANYLVFLTPRGDTRGLYATQVTSSGFAVRESGSGRSSVAFDYRIVARPYDTNAMRLPLMATLPQLQASKKQFVPLRVHNRIR